MKKFLIIITSIVMISGSIYGRTVSADTNDKFGKLSELKQKLEYARDWKNSVLEKYASYRNSSPGIFGAAPQPANPFAKIVAAAKAVSAFGGVPTPNFGTASAVNMFGQPTQQPQKQAGEDEKEKFREEAFKEYEAAEANLKKVTEEYHAALKEFFMGS